jgi:hypothetical protein
LREIRLSYEEIPWKDKGDIRFILGENMNRKSDSGGNPRGIVEEICFKNVLVRFKAPPVIVDMHHINSADNSIIERFFESRKTGCSSKNLGGTR